MSIFRHFTTKKIISVSLFVLILSSCIYFFSANFFEKSAFDLMLKLSANKRGSDSIINVVIDDASIKEIGAWPWKRTLYADMFDYLESSGAKAIIFDAILSSQGDTEDDAEFLNRIKVYENLVVGVNFSQNENDANKKEDLEYFKNHFALKLTDNNDNKLSAYNAYQEMLPNYIQSVKHVGSVNTVLDNDGTVRAFEPFVLMNGNYYPSLPMAAYLVLNSINNVVINSNSYELYEFDGKKHIFPITYKNGKMVQYIKWLAPFDKTSWISHKQIKASDIIKSYRKTQKQELPTISKETIKDKIIVVGATSNALYDLKITPMTVNMPGSTIQATILDNLLSDESISKSNIITNIIITLVLVLLIFLAVNYFVPLLSIISILLLGFLYFYTALFSFSNGLALNIVTPYIFIIISTIVAYSYKFSVEDYKKEKLKRAMKKYINTTVVDNIITNEEADLKLGGQKSEVTILMADIRGFTKFSENLDPNEVTKLLNEYFGLMIPIIEEYGGVVNKFIGDAILAVFNEPKKDKSHPLNAILCANKMLSALKDLKKKWQDENKPNIGISIGINTGTAFIGNIGTPNHMEYTVIGDTVNVASRIEAQNRQFNTQILISESTYEYAKDCLDVIKISSVEIRGREKHMDIYEIINILDKNEIN